MAAERRISTGRKTLFSVLFVVVILLLLEGVVRLRAWAFPGSLPPSVRYRVHWVHLAHSDTGSVGDPYLGFVYPSHSSRKVESADVTFSYSTDEHGFRNPSPWPSRADVVVVGDSMVFGFGVADDSVWTHLLADRLPNQRFINLGLPGTGPQQFTRTYERFGIPLNPDLLLYGLFPGNDLTDSIAFEEWSAAGAPGNYDHWRFFRGRVPQAAGGLLRRSYLHALVRETMREFNTPFSGRTVSLSGGGRVLLAPRTFFRVAEDAKPGHREFDLVLGAVEQAKKLSHEHSTEFLVVLFPSKEEVHLPLLGEPSPRLVEPFAAELSRRGIPHLDLTPFFQERARLGEGLFFEIDGHPNEAGNRLIAEVLYDHISAASRVGTTEAGLDVPRRAPRDAR
jgi:hypothetical protein